MVKAPFRGSSILPQKLLSFTVNYCNIQGISESINDNVFVPKSIGPDFVKNKISDKYYKAKPHIL